MPDTKEAIILDFQEFRLNNFNICITCFEVPFTNWTSSFCMLYPHNLNLCRYNLAKTWFYSSYFFF